MQREADRILRGGESALLGGASVARPFDRDARPAKPLLLLLAGLAGTLLLIACANVAGLLFGEAVWRRREMTVRSALGASRWRILRQLLVESAALAAIGTSIGILLAYLLTPLLVARAPAGVANLDDVGVDIRALTFACLLMAATTIASGCGPGLALARRIQGGALHLRQGSGGQVREGGRTSTASRRTQSALVIGEIALTMALLFAAGLLVTTLSRLNQVNPGFAPHNLLTVRLRPPASRYEDPARRRAFDVAVLERLSGLASVTSAAWVGPLAFSGLTATNVIQLERYEPLPGEPKPEAQTRAVSPAYFATMGIPVISGRAFAESDSDAAPRVAIVSSLFERRYSPAASPLGMRFRWQGAWWTVVGVVGDTKHQGLDTAELRTFYVPAAQKPGRANQLVLKVTTPPAAIASAATEAIRQVEPGVLIQDVAAMQQLIDRTLFDEQYRATLASAFALFAGLTDGSRTLRNAGQERQRSPAGDWCPDGSRRAAVGRPAADRRPRRCGWWSPESFSDCSRRSRPAAPSRR